MDIRNRLDGSALALKHAHHPEHGNTFGWPGRTIIGTSPFERKIINRWVQADQDSRYCRRTRKHRFEDAEYGSYWDTYLIVMIERPSDYQEFIDILSNIPRRSLKLPFLGKIKKEEAASLRDRNFRILRGTLKSSLSVAPSSIR